VTDQVPRSIPSKTTNASPNKRWVYADEKEKIGPFYCRVAVDSRRGLYYDFNWTALRDEALSGDPWGSGDRWNVVLVDKPKGMPTQKKQKRDAPEQPKRDVPKRAKRVTIDSKMKEDPDEADYIERKDTESDGDDDDDDDDDHLPTMDDASDSPSVSDADMGSDSDIDEPKTPSKSRKRRRNMGHPTPHSKAALARRAKGAGSTSPRKRAKLAVRSNNASLGYDSMAHLPQDPWLRAMHVLHVGSRPDALPCREEEFGRVLGSVSDLLEEGSGGCVCTSYHSRKYGD
jgi:origin recognition complex subunit 1